MSLTVRTAAPADLSQVRQFYRDRQYGGDIQGLETVLIAESSGELVGAVRLAPEQGTTVLRGMQVHPRLQRQGIGRQMLTAVARELGSTSCYCIPYAHLVDFYGGIGFRVIEPELAPAFLGERLMSYRARGDGRQYLLMRRTGVGPARQP